jgi:tetratricopeptide (TPR) repeat protein
MYERALTLAAMGLYKPATSALREVTRRAPEHGPAWQTLAELLRLAGKDTEARAADARASGLSPQWPAAKEERTAAEIDAAEQALHEHLTGMATAKEQRQAMQDHLRLHQTDVAAMRLLACLERSRDNMFVALGLFERALDLAPDYHGAREDLVSVLRVLSKDAKAVAQTAGLLAQAPDNLNYRVMHADALRNLGDMEGAISILDQLVQENPAFARLRCIYARVLRFAGRREESALQYRNALELAPGLGMAYSGLAKLRGDFLGSDDVAAMREHLREKSHDEDDDSRERIQFALGQTLEKMGNYGGSFAAYETCAALGKDPDYDPADDIREMRRRCAVFTSRTIARCASPRACLPTPIFVVGMPRAGSTLVEQILASHSRVEGTMELPALPAVVDHLSHSRLLVTRQAYPEIVTSLSPEQLAELGEGYIHEAAAYRRTGLPYFVDKRPWNWLESGFIRMILPQAKVVDVRREPMAACFAMYKQNMDQARFTNDFNHLARYYTEYVSTMSHYDEVMPGHVHLVHYKQLVEDSEAEIRRLLEYCGLPFEENCLRFWETERAVATPSAEQVRRPIFREGLEQWRHFEPWLGPLKEALEKAAAESAPSQPEGYDRALILEAMSVHEHAMKELQAVTKRVPTHPGAWKKLAELSRLAGKNKQADEAGANALRYAVEATNWRPSRDARTPEQLEAGKRALESSFAGKDHVGQMAALREQLAKCPIDAAAASLLSDLDSLDADEFTAIALLERTLELAPSWQAARHDLVKKLVNQREFVRALNHAAVLTLDAPDDPIESIVRADVLESSGKVPEAVALMEEVLRKHPRRPTLWVRYGVLLRDASRREESARAFRTCLEIAPTMGDAYAALADLKGNYLTDADVKTMRAHLADPSLDPASRMRMHYALGQALERSQDFSGSFSSYRSAAQLTRGSFLARGEAYDENKAVEQVRRIKHFFTARVLSRPAATPAPAPVTPIFVVGMPRAGSTLVEQILASHSKVEGTRELPVVAQMVRDIASGRLIANPNAYPACLKTMTQAELALLGERFFERASAFRHTDRPCFVDKRPWNWLDAGFIHLVLPHAKIIDIRREPMAACFAMYKQQLPRDAAFSYDLRDLGHYYNLYVGLMEHWKKLMPGRILFVQYERLVGDTEHEISRMLDYCGLPFEENCLRFWETDRAVSTPSAEQVRRPIYKDAVELWRNYEAWLGPLKAALAEPALA